MTRPYVLVDSPQSPSPSQIRLALITPLYLLPGLPHLTPSHMYPLFSLASLSTTPWLPLGPKTLLHYLRLLSLTLLPSPTLQMPSTMTFMPCRESCSNAGTRLTSGASDGGMYTVRPPSLLLLLSEASHTKLPSRRSDKPLPKRNEGGPTTTSPPSLATPCGRPQHGDMGDAPTKSLPS